MEIILVNLFEVANFGMLVHEPYIFCQWFIHTESVGGQNLLPKLQAAPPQSFGKGKKQVT